MYMCVCACEMEQYPFVVVIIVNIRIFISLTTQSFDEQCYVFATLWTLSCKGNFTSLSSPGSGSPRRQRQRTALEQQTAISPPQVSGSSQSGLDSVSLQSASSGGSGQHLGDSTPENELQHHSNAVEKRYLKDEGVVVKELNGDVRSLSDSSGVNSYTEIPNEKVQHG